MKSALREEGEKPITMNTQIQYEEIFFDKVNSGINLFTGAGFSILPSPDGKYLPAAKDLAIRICDEFLLPPTLASDLELVSMYARQKDSRRFDKFLRDSYRVFDINSLYSAINLMNIRTYITTNIDNLFQTIVEKDAEKYINPVVNGKAKRIGKPIDYIPLHGDITDPDSYLYFGSLEIARAVADNRRLFSVMENEVYRYPTLFWGYGFHDSSVMSTLGSVLTSNPTNIWIQFTEDNREKAEAYKDLGFNIIIGDTEGLLKDIQRRLSTAKNRISKDLHAPAIWNSFEIPTQNQLTVNLNAVDYFRDGKMAWNVIFSKYPYETVFVKEAYEKHLKNKNLIIIGSSQCGKTTLLRQLSISIEKPGYYISELTKRHAEKLVKSLKTDITVFMDDCSRDMEAFAVLARHSKIQLIGITDENSYESAKHLLSNVKYETYYLPDLNQDEANKAFEHISPSIRKTSFVYSKNPNEKYSYLEFGFDNIQNIISKNKIEKFLLSITDSQIREILFITAYLNKNGSYLSADILWRIIHANSYDDLAAAIKKTNQALSSIDEVIDNDLDDQDYYILRSNAFSRYLVASAIDKHRHEFGKAIRKLIEEVPRGMITRYNVYRRTAYDANLFYIVFRSEAENLYDIIYSFDSSPYTLQQKALYLSRNHKYNEAFSLIDKASQDMPYNFSIQNTKAIITFEANKHSREHEARSQLDKAMSILATCYKSDKRKVYHAQKYAEYAIFISEKYQDGQYLETAKEWLRKEEMGDSVSTRTKKLIEKVETEIHVCQNRCH